MPCPFGYTVEDEEEEECLDDEEEESKDKEGETHKDGVEESQEGDRIKSHPGGDGLRNRKDEQKTNKKKKDKGIPVPGGTGGDPLEWFYANQIKCEADFQAKKDKLRAEAKKRLDEIMDKKNQRMMWPSDSEFDNLSLSSGELSDLDSDIHSLASVRSCAYSWIQSARYSAPAAQVCKWAAAISLVVSGYAMYASYMGLTTIKPVMGIMKHNEWAAYNFLTGLALAGGSIAALVASNGRSKKMLLSSQIIVLITMTVTLILSTLLFATPPTVDVRMQAAICSKYGDKVYKGQSDIICKNLQGLGGILDASIFRMRVSTVLQSICCVTLACLGMWHMFEICFIEKKGVKHTKRHRRNRFSIPWDRIKIVGKPLPCGQGGRPQGGAGAGKAGAAAASACPFSKAPKNKTV